MDWSVSLGPDFLRLKGSSLVHPSIYNMFDYLWSTWNPASVICEFVTIQQIGCHIAVWQQLRPEFASLFRLCDSLKQLQPADQVDHLLWLFFWSWLFSILVHLFLAGHPEGSLVFFHWYSQSWCAVEATTLQRPVGSLSLETVFQWIDLTEKWVDPQKIDGKMTVFWSEPLNIPWTSWNLNWVCLMGTSVPLIFFLLNCYFFLGYIDTHPIPGIVHHGSLLIVFWTEDDTSKVSIQCCCHFACLPHLSSCSQKKVLEKGNTSLMNTSAFTIDVRC